MRLNNERRCGVMGALGLEEARATDRNRASPPTPCSWGKNHNIFKLPFP